MAGVTRADELAEMRDLLQQASALLRQAVDAGAGARDGGTEARRAVDREWEAFLSGFLGYLRQKGRERGENLLAGISFSRVFMGGK